MAIFDSDPSDWQQLQQLVGQMFSEMGCAVEVEKQVELVRGRKNVDVFVVDNGVTPTAQYLCECKFWRKSIPQDVIHAFRTVVADCGAHRGFVISIAGFQEGARTAVHRTNIDLVIFEELQGIFFDRWRIAMGRRAMGSADDLFPYWDPFGRLPKFEWTDDHRRRINLLAEAYNPIIGMGAAAEQRSFHQKFPIEVPLLDAAGEIDGKLAIKSYRELYTFIDENKEKALYHYRLLFGEVRPK